MVIWSVVQQNVDSLQGWRSHVPSGHPFQSCTTLGGSIFFLLSNQNFPGCSLACHLRSFCWAPLRRLWLYLLPRSTLGSGKLQLGCPLSLLQAEQTQSFQPLLIPHVLWTPDRFIGSPVDLLWFVNCTEGPRLG